jgi:hypothetical protein
MISELFSFLPFDYEEFLDCINKEQEPDLIRQ